MSVVYVCLNCGREVPYESIRRKVKCPYCGGKILIKQRPKMVKVVKAI